MINDRTLDEAKRELDKLSATLVSCAEEVNDDVDDIWDIDRDEVLDMLRADLEDMCYFVMGSDKKISEAEEDMFDRLFEGLGMKASRTEKSRREIKALASVIKRGMPRTLAFYCSAASKLDGSSNIPSESTDKMFTDIFDCYIKVMCHITAADGEVSKREVGAVCDYIEGLCRSASEQTGLRIDFKQEYVDLAISLLT